MPMVADDPPDDEIWPDPVVIPIEESIDLHLFRPSEVAEVVDAYLDAALAEGFCEVRIVHGRGKGVQRARVRRLLDGDPRVEAFADAPGDRGGWGATLARLRQTSGDGT
ncbi:Smr/MutS family protein [Myxococcota bacterium]|nr:Smr/MutS family protein [Myxococcota bacterium]